MRKGSIALNLFGFSLAWLILALALTAFLLSNLYSRALDASLSETLDFHLETLVGEFISQQGESLTTYNIADPRFSRPASGWYWQVSEIDGKVISFSSSMVGSVLLKLDAKYDVNNMRTEKIKDGFGIKIRVIERKITLDGASVLILVSGNLDEINEQVSNFRGQALIVLGAVGIMLAIMSAIVARFALRPIDRISRAIEAIREGDIKSIEGDYPKEIAPLAEEVNELLSSNARIIERARSQVGNLAHGLKTPLAVLRNEAATKDTKFSEIVRFESEKMNLMVASYLKRAQMSARSTVVGQKSNASMVVSRLIRVMGKLHSEQKIILEIEKEKQIWFRGEEADFEEMAGNLLDNACKWAKSEVRVRLFIDEKYSSNNRQLSLIVEDDGVGLDEKQVEKVLRRGVRLDEKTQGSGLGLDIVKELVDIYGGSLVLERSKMGGLKVELILPATKNM
jgi:signal transduction histidine kinase